MVQRIKTQDKPELLFNSVTITDYSYTVRIYDFDSLPDDIRSEVLDGNESLETDCS